MIITKKIPLSYISKAIRFDIFIVTTFSLLAFWVHAYANLIQIPILLSTFLGTAISLILSFNLAQSYDRWWEGRKIWGEIVNDSRAFALQLQTFSKNEEVKVSSLVKYQIAWVQTLVTSLRGQEVDKDIEKYLSSEEYAQVQQALHKPLAINTFIKDGMQNLSSLDVYEKVQVDSTIVRLLAHMGKAERIKNTVFPKEYQVVLHIAIYFFLGFLSVSLANLGHQWEILLLPVIAIPFFLVEKTARHLQDPFNNEPSDVPISSIARNIEINLLSLLEEEEIPEPLERTGFYLN